MTTIKCPTYVKQEHLEFLDDLRESGETNMFEAVPYIVERFEVDVKFATKILIYWMKTFSTRHNLES